jgi:membrane protein YdbS with pleckstrin-like domain
MSTKHFPGQRPEEKIISVLHRHWFDIASHFVVLAGMVLLIFISLGLSPVIFKTLDIGNASAVPLWFLVSSFLLFLWLYIFLVWIDYYFDVWVITNERIMNIEQKSLFTRVISEVTLTRVQDVTAKIEGFFPTLLDFGDILVQTAGEEKHFHFRNVPNPEQYKEEIMVLVKAAMEKRDQVSLN